MIDPLYLKSQRGRRADGCRASGLVPLAVGLIDDFDEQCRGNCHLARKRLKCLSSHVTRLGTSAAVPSDRPPPPL